MIYYQLFSFFKVKIILNNSFYPIYFEVQNKYFIFAGVLTIGFNNELETIYTFWPNNFIRKTSDKGTRISVELILELSKNG